MTGDYLLSPKKEKKEFSKKRDMASLYSREAVFPNSWRKKSEKDNKKQEQEKKSDKTFDSEQCSEYCLKLKRKLE